MQTTTITKTLFINPVDLQQIVDMIAPCADFSEFGSTTILGYVNFKVTSGGLLKVCATDGSRLSVGTFIASYIGDSLNHNIPASAFSAVSKLRKDDLKAGIYLLIDVIAGVTRYSLQLHKFVTDYSKEIISGDCRTDDYPNYEQVIPDNLNSSVEIANIKDPMRFGSHTSVQRLVEHCKAIEKACYKPETKKDNAKHGIITLNIGAPDKAGDIGAQCDIGMSHEHFSYKASVLLNDDCTPYNRVKFAFCAKFLAQALDHGATVTMNYNTHLKPVVFTYENIPVKHLLMPVRIG